jgi:integrase
MRRKKTQARDRVLSDDEIRAVWNAAEGAFGGIVKLGLLTAQRRQQIADMRWDDLRDGTWTIPAEERAKGTAELLKLPKLALDVIETQPQIAGNPHVFAGRGKGPFNSWGQRKAEIDEKLPSDMPHWTIHDLRRTARSLMARADVRPDIAERVLGHAIVGVEGVYDRHHYADQKADALARLASLITTIINPPKGNVVRLKRRPGGHS